MKRRNFLGTVAGTTALVTRINGFAASRNPPEAKVAVSGKLEGRDSALDADGTLAGKTLEEFRDRYRSDPFDDYIPFHDRYVVDHQYGGFTLKTGWNGPTLTFDKTTWYEGRGTWTYSFLYNKINSDPKHLEAARRSVEFVMKHKPTGNSLWPTSYSREGKATAGPDKRIYGDEFLANGFAEYLKIKGNESY